MILKFTVRYIITAELENHQIEKTFLDKNEAWDYKNHLQELNAKHLQAWASYTATERLFI